MAGTDIKDLVKETKETNRHLAEMSGLEREDKIVDAVRESARTVSGNQQQQEQSRTSSFVEMLHKAEESIVGFVTKTTDKTYEFISGIAMNIGEHIKSGFKKAVGFLRSKLTEIFAPISDLMGPLVATAHWFAVLGKKIFGSNEQEKQTKELQKLRKAAERGDERARKELLLQDKGKSKWLKYLIAGTALLVGLVVGFAKSLKIYFKPFIGLLKKFKNTKIGKGVLAFFDKVKVFFGKVKVKIMGFFTRTSKFFKNVVFLFKNLPGAKLLGKLGNLVGKFFIPLFMVWDAVRGWLAGETVRDKILGAAAGMLGAFLEFPVWVANKILGLFTDFKLDFSAEAIIKSVNGISDWLLVNVTTPVLDFFMVTLPNAFSAAGDAIRKKLGDIGDFASLMKNQMIDMLISLLGDMPLIGNQIKKLEQFKTPMPDIGGQPITKTAVGELKTTTKGIAVAKASREQTEMSGRAVSTLTETNKNIVKNTEMNKQMLDSHSTSVQVVTAQPDIPTDMENMGGLMSNKQWGAN